MRRMIIRTLVCYCTVERVKGYGEKVRYVWVERKARARKRPEDPIPEPTRIRIRSRQPGNLEFSEGNRLVSSDVLQGVDQARSLRESAMLCKT
jgi:hypothetical protein